MKKIYLLAFSICIGSGLLAQVAVKDFGRKYQPTRENTERMTPLRVEGNQHSVGMRAVFLSEDFEAVAGPFPTAIPATWTTVDVDQTNGTVTTSDDTVGPAFEIMTSVNANAGGYWPVAETGNDNQFAGANDDASPCDCDMGDIFIEAPSIDFSTAVYPAITFDLYHDQNFGGGDAFVSVSSDGGASYTDIQYPLDADGFLPVEEGVWQTIVLTLFEYTAVSDVRIRFSWSDEGEWASGFAIDNVVVGDLEEYSLTADKAVIGDWNQETFGLGFWDYSMIPLSQTSPVHVTAVASNNGFNDLTNVNLSIEVFQNSTSVGTYAGVADDVLESLTKDTLSVSSDYFPDALGMYDITATVTSDSDALETNTADNVRTTGFEMTECTYARDFDGAQAFMLLAEGGDMSGNLFDIYADETFDKIQVAVGGGSVIGAAISGLVFDFLGFDNNGDPIFEFVDGSETEEMEVTEEMLNSVDDNIFSCVRFIEPLNLLADHVYLVAISSTDSLRVPVSGSNVWVSSWNFTANAFGATSGIPMVRLAKSCSNPDETCDIEINVQEIETNAVLNQNMPNPASTQTTISYSMKKPAKVVLTVTTMTGQVVESIDLGNRSFGRFSYVLNVEDYAPGMYMYSINDGTGNVTRKMIVE